MASAISSRSRSDRPETSGCQTLPAPWPDCESVATPGGVGWDQPRSPTTGESVRYGSKTSVSRSATRRALDGCGASPPSTRGAESAPERRRSNESGAARSRLPAQRGRREVDDEARHRFRQRLEIVNAMASSLGQVAALPRSSGVSRVAQIEDAPSKLPTLSVAPGAILTDQEMASGCQTLPAPWPDCESDAQPMQHQAA